MTLTIRHCEILAWPSEDAVSAALAPFELSIADLQGALTSFSDTTDPDASRFTETIASHLAQHLSANLKREKTFGNLRPATNRYVQGLGHNADVVISRNGHQSKIFVEIEFRPNFEKDLVKFRVGHIAGSLALGVLLVSTDRRAVRGSYGTIPEFRGVVEIVTRFQPDHPTLVLGMDISIARPDGAA